MMKNSIKRRNRTMRTASIIVGGKRPGNTVENVVTECNRSVREKFDGS